jgi:hypothetical protein
MRQRIAKFLAALSIDTPNRKNIDHLLFGHYLKIHTQSLNKRNSLIAFARLAGVGWIGTQQLINLIGRDRNQVAKPGS